MEPNCKEIRPGTYLVRTQAGFRRALKTDFEDYGFSYLRTSLNNWPEHYPAVVSFNHDFHFNTGRITCFIAYPGDFKEQKEQTNKTEQTCQ